MVTNTAFASPFDADPFSMTEEELRGERIEATEPVDYSAFEFGLQDPDYVAPAPNDPLPFQAGQTQQSLASRFYRPPDEAFNQHYREEGIASDAQIEQFNKEYELLTNSGLFSQAELGELEVLREGMLTGSMSPFDVEVPLKYLRRDLIRRDEGQQVAENAGVDYTNPTTFGGAKQYADQVYMGTLYAERDKHELNSPEYKEINRLISEGAPNFQTQAEFQRYTDADDNDFFRIAADAQAATMQDYLNRNDIQLETGQGIRIPYNNEMPSMHLNTGTALNASIAERDNFRMGALGDYNMIGFSDPKEMNTFGRLVQVGLQIASIMNPTLAPMLTGAQTLLATGGDLEAALTAGATAWAGQNITKDLVSDTLTDVGITPEALNVSQEVFDDYIVGTATDVAVGGESLEDSLKDTLVSDAGDVAEGAVDWAKENFPSLDLPEFDTPDEIKAVGDFIVDAGSALGETLQPVVDVASDIGRPIEDVVREVGSTAEDIVEPFKDTIEDALGNVDLSGLAGINMDGTYRPTASNIPTQVEDLFSDELFKFETEIGISPEYFEYEEFYDNDLMPRQQPRTYSF